MVDADQKKSRVIFYGSLDMILEFNVPDDPFWGDIQGQTRLLAAITPCVTNGVDASKKVASYRGTTTQIITDLHAISSVVGRVQTRNWWGIVDRSGDYSRTIFIDDN